MSLLTWLPLISDIKNKGLKNANVSSTGTLAYNDGKIGKALTFSNTGITLNPAPINTNVTEHSFAFWYKTTNTSATQCLYNGRTAVGSAIAVFLIGDKFRYDDGAQHTFNYSMTANTWTHVVITRDASNVKLYINGTLNQTMSASNFTCTTSTASIGLSSTSGTTPSGNAIIGQLNDYRIYDHILSAKEIKELSKGLCMHMPMDWGSNPNLQPNSNTFGTTAGNPNNFTHETKVYDGHNAIRMTCKTDNYSGGPYRAGFAKGTLAIVGTKYTWSMYIRGSSAFTMNTVGHECGGTKQVSVTTEWQKVTHTWTVTDGTYTAWVFYGRTWALGDWIEVKDFKVEEGSVATPYLPNTAEALYTSRGYGTKFTQECSGYNKAVTVNSNSTIGVATDSPRGTGTNINKTGKLTIANAFPVGTFPVFTVNGWIRTTADATQTLWYDFFGISANNSSGSDSLFRMEVASTTGTAFNWFGPMQKDAGGLFNTSITAGQWYMVTLVSNGTQLLGYKNGVQYGTFTPDTDARKGWQAKGTFYIGDSNIYFDVADVRIYSTVLSADDIKELYQIPAQIDKSGKIYCNTFVEA